MPMCPHHTMTGDKIVYAYPDNGNNIDRERAHKYLTLGQTYTVKALIVGAYYTTVLLDEVPYVKFNSTNFNNTEATVL